MITITVTTDTSTDLYKSLIEFLKTENIPFTQSPVLLQTDVSSSAVVHKCIDCGIEDETVKKRTDGSGYQCYKCYKDELYFEDEYR